MALPLFQVDAFPDRPFAGNPASVCLLPGPRDAEWMQKVAMEMNLSETAFLYPDHDGYRLRWFTPTTEVALCGHATLASAHILWEQDRLERSRQARFYTPSGLLTAGCHENQIELDFPATPAQPTEAPTNLLEALAVTPRFVGKARFDYLIEVDSEATVRGLKPDHAGLACLGVRGVIVTAASETSEFDFVSRFFAPGAGITEDPVTGSAHCCLAPYWAARLGKPTMRGYQASARGGVVGVHLAGDRVRLRGRAVTVFAGQLLC
jgi:PhzF family phenazine biosynthesis protein